MGHEKGASAFLKNGFGQFKIIGVYKHDREGNPLVTKNNDPKVRIDLIVVDANGDSKKMYEHITQKNIWKLEQLYDVCGVKNLFPNSVLDVNVNHLLNGSGHCTIKTQNSELYGSASVVGKYFKDLHPGARQEIIDDDLSVMDQKNAVGFGDDKTAELDDLIPF
jgi:hypothetical protein